VAGLDEGQAGVEEMEKEGKEGEKLVMIREELPSAGADDVCGAVGDAGWQGLSAAERISGAGPAPAAVDCERGGQVSGRSGEAWVNPQGYPWENENFIARSQVPELERLWGQWQGGSVKAGEDGVRRELLDAWQGFAYDVMDQKAEEREALELLATGASAEGGADEDGEDVDAQALPTGSLSKYKPVRMIMTGTAGTGKSRTLRAIVRRRRERVLANGKTEEQSAGSCISAAPTGCASFHMKYGATTLHRAFGLGIDYCAPTQNQRTLRERARRFRAARLFILDEFSMIGRQMLGKLVFRVAEALRSASREFGRDVTMGGRDLVLAGDLRQAKPLGDEALYKNGPYKGKGRNAPGKKGKSGVRREPPPGTPTIEELTGRGVGLREEFEDVVLLREVFRVDRGDDTMDSATRREYEREADRFLEVLNRMADLTWTREDREWLARRNKRVLASSPEGRKQLEEFADAPLLMDSRKQKKAAGSCELDGADVMNRRELNNLAKRMGVPVLRLRGHHDKPKGEKDMHAELLDGDEFRGLAGELFLCKGARVLLPHNLWVEAGLMNGALGYVQGFVWPQGGDPESKESKKRSPLCVIVEFDDVNLGEMDAVDERGDAVFVDRDGGRVFDGTGTRKKVPRNFFPGLDLGVDEKGKPRAEKCVPIFRASVASGEQHVVRHQFPLTLAWALTHWKAQGMTLRRARVLLGDSTASQAGIGFVAVSRVKHPWHLMFESDLPEYEAFEKAKWTEGFRSRMRYSLRMEAKASRTLRRYGFCALDRWTAEEAALAEELLKHVRAEGDLQRSAAGMGGDEDAWIWGDSRPPIEEALG
jgi:hypothetical protein